MLPHGHLNVILVEARIKRNGVECAISWVLAREVRPNIGLLLLLSSLK